MKKVMHKASHCFVFLVGIYSLLFHCTLAHANNGFEPKICLGASVDGNPKKRGLPTNGVCPPGYAVFSASLTGRRWTSASNIMIRPSCCELPENDMLLDEHVIVDSQCPDGYVVTGVKPYWEKYKRTPYLEVQPLRCSKVNSTKYLLGDGSTGVLWGVTVSEWHDPKRLNWAELPASFRYGAGRTSHYSWQHSGCTGYPFGSFLVGKSTKYCKGLTFKRLLYRPKPRQELKRATSLENPTTSLEAVTIFPECSEIRDYFSETPRCIK